MRVDESTLEHHGVKGMRWGVRKKDDTGAVGKAHVQQMLNGEVGGSVFFQNGNMTRRITKGKAFLSGSESIFHSNPELAKAKTLDEIKSKVVDPINPDFHKMGGKMNCRRCTFAYEMRRRGLDVKATNTISAHGQDLTGLYNATHQGKNVKFDIYGRNAAVRVRQEARAARKNPHAETPFTNLFNATVKSQHFGVNNIPLSGKNDGAKIMSAMKKLPNGSRGEFSVVMKMGGGHSMAYEIIQGKPVIIDNQSKQIYHTKQQFDALGRVVRVASHTRLDNVKLNEDFLAKWVKNA